MKPAYKGGVTYLVIGSLQSKLNSWGISCNDSQVFQMRFRSAMSVAAVAARVEAPDVAVHEY